MLKMVSWNVNGLRSCVQKGFVDFFKQIDADIFALQESKLQPEQIDLEFDGYYSYWNSAQKKGYSGTVVYSKIKPIQIVYGMDGFLDDHEGRIITLEFEQFYFVNVYTPNSKKELLRLDYRMEWEDAFRNYLLSLSKHKQVIICGDLNVARLEIDLKNPKTNHYNAGFTDQEREKINQLLNTGFIDTYRYFYPDLVEKYTWWSYMFQSRKRNVGWRIDYFLVSNGLKDKIIDSLIYHEIEGSDHCPIGLEVEL